MGRKPKIKLQQEVEWCRLDLFDLCRNAEIEPEHILAKHSSRRLSDKRRDIVRALYAMGYSMGVIGRAMGHVDHTTARYYLLDDVALEKCLAKKRAYYRRMADAAVPVKSCGGPVAE